MCAGIVITAVTTKLARKKVRCIGQKHIQAINSGFNSYNGVMMKKVSGEKMLCVDINPPHLLSTFKRDIIWSHLIVTLLLQSHFIVALTKYAVKTTILGALLTIKVSCMAYKLGF